MDTPSVRGYHSLVGLGPDRAGVVVLGGERTDPPSGGLPLNDAWRLDADGEWRLASEGLLLPFGDASVFDSRSDSLVTFGLVADDWTRPLVETWTLALSSGTWSRQSSDQPPGVHRAAYDAGSDRIVAYTDVGATWAYDLDADAWIDMQPEVVPPPRSWAALAYDSAADRVVLFGGEGPPGQPNLADTWTYDLDTNRWIEMQPARAPSGRHYAAMAYDPVSGRVILYGGADRAEVPNGETWAYDLADDAWTLLADAGGPGPLAWHAMAADAGDGTLALYGGGTDRRHFTDELWRFSPTTDTWGLDR